MHLIQLLVYVPTTISCLILGLIVYINNRNSRVNRRFFYLIIGIILWLVCLFVADTTTSSHTALNFVRTGLIFASLFPFIFVLFCSVFPDNKLYIKKSTLIGLFLPTIFFSAVSFSPLMIGSVEVSQIGAQVKESSILYSLQSLYLIIYFLLGFGILIHKRKKLDGIRRSQIYFVITGVGITLFINIITNELLVIFKGDSSYGVLLGIPSIIIFIGSITYSIVKHSLFDIRLVVARALGYLLSLGAIVCIYSLLVFGLIANFIDPAKAGIMQQFIYVALAVVTALTFPPIKRFFDRLSNKLFYQDAYEPQDLLNELNNLLVSQIELDKILKDGAQIIQKYLKAFYVQFYIDATDKTEAKLVTVGDTRGSDTQKAIHGIWQHASSKLLVVDDLPEEQAELRRQLLDQDIAVIARFLSSTQQGKEVGYLILGIKRSGSMYNKQDIRMVSIMADELVIAIQNALRFEEIQQFNITLQQKIDDATHQLRRANEKLKALDETKDEFISMASHQLRTPLTSVKGYVSMVLEGDAGKVSAPMKKLLDQAFMSSQRMVYLIADLLNVSRLRTGKFVIDAQPTNLADLVEGEINQLTETAKGRGLELTYNKPKDFPTLMLDETKTRQVIMNFADNAIYYTPSGGHISVNLTETPESIEFTVVDDGLGVPKHDQHHMFTKFFRAGNAKKARPDGTGLGLFMAKKVVIAQGGAIIFRSEEGKGSTFGFSFPKAKLKVQGVSEKTK